MSTNNSSNNVGVIGGFSCPTRPNDVEVKRGKGRPKGSVNARAEITIRNGQIESNDTLFTYDVSQGKFIMQRPVNVIDAGDLRQLCDELDGLEKLPPCHAETRNKYLALIFGEITDAAKLNAAGKIISRFYSSDAVYEAWLRQKTGEVSPKMTRTLSQAEVEALEAELLASLK